MSMEFRIVVPIDQLPDMNKPQVLRMKLQTHLDDALTFPSLVEV